MVAQVYSYRRFSSPQQKFGGSIERQNDYANLIAEEYGLTLNEKLVMTDEGLSAFHAEHVSRGALGIFIKAVEEGLVERGSILIVESLDRLSRDQPMDAMHQFNELIGKGITIITANDSQVYNTASIAKDPSKLFISIAIMIRAHDESLTKQKRSVAFVKQQVRKFELEGKGDVAGTTPFWLSRTKKGFILNEHADIARDIVTSYLSNKGLNTISRELYEKGVPSPQKGKPRWGITTIRNVLDNKALYGVKHFKLRYLVDGQQVVEEYNLSDYYPALITEDDYKVIQTKKKKKATSREAYGDVTYLLSGYGKGRSVCSKCGQAVGSQLQKQRNRKGEYTQSVMRLHCMKHKESADCCKSFKSARLEEAFVDSVSHKIDGRFLTSFADNAHQESVLKAKIEDVEETISNLVETLMVVREPDTKAQLQKSIVSAEEEKRELQNQLTAIATSVISEEEALKINELKKAALDIRNNDERKLLKQIMIEVIDKIVINFEKQSLVVHFRNQDTVSVVHIPVIDIYVFVDEQVKAGRQR
ncbi:recombinase family protein [Enterovibrio norvegicus]|uniref:recombinase family protein n=1 Tax=Enterovibrio norvegicus TaxID=188144 RepID=UPI0010BEE239|nr:recombinase family protein [Enterovibrio norvegicus]TKF12841.1 recombinase family protein [Enterovibrio norvegicus]